MWKNRFCYFGALIGGVVFYLANQQWLGWILLLFLLCLPVLSLIMSLPALFTLKLKLRCPGYVLRGEKLVVKVDSRCFFPVPLYSCRVQVYRPLTAEHYRLQQGDNLPTDHCGGLQCSREKAWACDYLGLFRFRLSKPDSVTVLVRPKPDAIQELPRLQRPPAVIWKPKPGGGFAENHELRLYRPGDQLNQIHWKMSAKTGKLIIREPMIPMGQQARICICLAGSGDVLDRKFGQLMGICNRLLQLNIPHEIAAITGDGMVVRPVSSEKELTEAVDTLLMAAPAAREQSLPYSGSWTYRIGGEADD